MKTLFIDTLFPVCLIIGGLALATVAIFEPAVPLSMTPALFPQPVNIFYNLDSPSMTRSEVQNFISRDFVGLDPSSLEQGSGA